MTAEPQAPLHGAKELLGQPLTALATALTQHARPAAGAHPAQEAVHAPAIAFLRLIGSFDRGSVPKSRRADCDSRVIT
jgi:hypothetical protein